MASIDPTGLDLDDPRAVRRRMAFVLKHVRLEACGIRAAEYALIRAFDKLLQRDPALYRATLRAHFRMCAAGFVEIPHAPVLEERRRWQDLRDALDQQIKDSCGSYVSRHDDAGEEE